MGEEGGGVLPSQPVSKYSCSVRTFLKLIIMNAHKNDSNTVLTYGQCFFLDKCLIEAILVTCFGTQRPYASSNIVLEEENNLTTITDWLFP